MKHRIQVLTILPYLLVTLLQGCIGEDIVEDFVEPRINITNMIEVMIVGDNHQYEADFFDSTGTEQPAEFIWNSSDPEVVEISGNGLAVALAPGVSTLSASANQVSTVFSVTVFDPTEVDEDSVRMAQEESQNGERVAELSTVSSYPLTGTATLKMGSSLTLELSDDFQTTSSLPGLYIYLSNNTNSIANAYEVGEVTQFSGAQTYTIDRSVSINDFSHVLFYCKPFRVGVGQGTFEP